MLYALSEKFGDEISKNKLKEVLTVTEIGRMIKEEGLREGELKGELKGKAEGKAEGKSEGKAELLIRQLTKKFNKVPIDYISKIKVLPEEIIDVIATEIFDFNSIEDIRKFLS
jgi:predicted transposase YdaD